MKAKVIIILSTVAVLHLVLGGMFLTGGCAPEEPPMPPGVYVPQPSTQPSVTEETQSDLIGPAPGTEEFKNQVGQKEEPVIIDPVVSAEPTVPVKQPEQKKTAPAITDKDTTYVVQKGDSLWKISRTYGISVAELAAYNNIAPSKPIRVGQKLIIPAGSNAVKAAKTAPVVTEKKAEKKKAEARKDTGKKKKKSGTVKKVPIPADGIHVVKAGDSFSKIAVMYGLKVSDIAAANPGVSSNRLQIGQKLNLPTGKPVDAPTIPSDVVSPKIESPEQTTPQPLDEDNLLKDIPNPDSTVSPTGLPASEAEKQETPVTGMDQPLVSEEAIKAVTDTNLPAEDAMSQQTAVPTEDTTIDALAAKYGIKADEVKVLNPALPADGTIKAGTVVRLP